MKRNEPIADHVTLLKIRVSVWGIKLKVNPKSIRIQQMKTKWGSCTSTGIITLASDLLDQDEKFQDFVIVHELLHLRLERHTRLFNALMTFYVPDWRQLDIKRKLACLG